MKKLIRILFSILYLESMALNNPRCIIYKLLDIQKQKKEVLLKQAVQRISGKKNEEGKKKKSLKQFVFRMKSLLPRHTRKSWKTNKGVLGSG